MKAILLLAAAVFLVAAAAPLPDLVMPQGWTQDPPRIPGLTIWRRTRNPAEAYPTRLFLEDRPQEVAVTAISQFRTRRTCSTGQAGMLERAIHICGFVVDRDEQCGTHPAHRFVGLVNLGPPEVVAQTKLFVSMDAGYVIITYERPAAEFVASGTGEKDDNVLAAVHEWCQSLPPLAVAPSPAATMRGDSFDSAIVINAESDDAGTRKEYEYVNTLTCGTNGRYVLKSQALVRRNGKSYDVLQLACNDGDGVRTIYFDITSEFGMPTKPSSPLG